MTGNSGESTYDPMSEHADTDADVRHPTEDIPEGIKALRDLRLAEIAANNVREGDEMTAVYNLGLLGLRRLGNKPIADTHIVLPGGDSDLGDYAAPQAPVAPVEHRRLPGGDSPDGLSQPNG